MSRARVPQSPPELPGFRYVELLGSGGFADVFLYEQQLPKRRVAVKVLLAERMTSGSVDAFTAEANVMAMLSTHPAIVTIHQAGVAADGRPYLVMEYCPKPNLQARYRREPFAVAEALRVGVQVAAAVETAHRAGVLHRDIKPANILVTEYNRPALTDFGIASTSGAADVGGLSIPWSPPEALVDAPGADARGDVWSLGATVYSLLAARSPFERPGERNTAADLIDRITTLPLPPLDRPDAPASLQRVLERAMATAPAGRYDSALAFARALQAVQIELSHSVTPIDILDDGVGGDLVADEDDGLTRVRGVVDIAPERPAPAPGHSGMWAPEAAPTDDETVVRPPTVIAASPPAAPESGEIVVSTALRAAAAIDPAPVAAEAPPAPPAPAPPAATGSPRPRARRALWFALSAGAFVLVMALVVVLSLSAVLGGGEPAATAPPSDRPVDVLPDGVPTPAELAGAPGPDGVVFTWTNPAPESGDGYLWGVVARGGEVALERTEATTVTVPPDPSGTTCIEVLTRRANGQASEPASLCVP